MPRGLEGALTRRAARGQAPAGSAVTVSTADADGVNPFLLTYAAQSASFNLTCVRAARRTPQRARLTRARRSVQVGKVPAATAAQGQLAALKYAFATWKWDCILSGVVQTPDKFSALDFFMPTHPYTLAVVAPRADVPTVTIDNVLGAWALPFDKPVWAMLAAIILLSGSCMYVFERKAHSYDDFGPEYQHWTDRWARGVYRATSNWTAVGSFTPVTPAGRVYSMTFAFVMLLMQSAYTANLAAFFTRQAVPSQRVSSLDAFATLGVPVCVDASDASFSNWLSTTYAVTKQQPVPNAAQLVAAVASGQCAGGFSSDSALGFALSQAADPAGVFCELEIVQTGLGMNTYAMAVNTAAAWATPAAVRALNSVFGVALAYGLYGLESDLQFSDPRPQCAANENKRTQAALALDALKPLGANQLAGVLFVLAMGLGVSGIVFLIMQPDGLRVAFNKLRGMPPQGREDPDAPPPPPPPEKDADDEPTPSSLAMAAIHGPAHALTKHQQIALSAMMSIEKKLEISLRRFDQITQAQRELDVAFIMQEGAHAAPVYAPLAVIGKMGRALAFGMRAVAEISLCDPSGTELAALGYGVPGSEAMAAAHAHMDTEKALKLEEALSAFLKTRVAAKKKALANGTSRRPERAQSASSLASSASGVAKPKPKGKGKAKIPSFDKR